MTNIRGTASIRGTVLDLPHALSLSGTDCNVLLVSSRTLFFIQQFGLGEMTFRSRYASEFLDGARYVIAETAAELDDINDIVNLYGLEVVDVGCDIVAAIQGVEAALLSATSNACACGTVGETIEVEAGTPGGTPPPGFGEPDPVIVDRLCKAANAIHESIVDTIVELNNNNVDGFLSLGFGVVSGLVSAIIAAAFIPVVGVLVVGVAGAIVGATLAILAAGLNLQDLEDDLAAGQQDLICALVEAPSAAAARDDYIAVLAGIGSSAVNNALIAALMTNNVLDLLYFSTGGSEAFLDTYVAPISCVSCAAPFSDYVILPSNALSSWTSAEGTLGTGTVVNDGSQFTINSVVVTGGSIAGQSIVAMSVQGFVDSQVGDQNMITEPSGTGGGILERINDITGFGLTTDGERSVAFPCGVIAVTNPNGNPFPFDHTDAQMIFFYGPNAFFVDYKAKVSPQAC